MDIGAGGDLWPEVDTNDDDGEDWFEDSQQDEHAGIIRASIVRCRRYTVYWRQFLYIRWGIVFPHLAPLVLKLSDRLASSNVFSIGQS